MQCMGWVIRESKGLDKQSLIGLCGPTFDMIHQSGPGNAYHVKGRKSLDTQCLQ